MSKRNISRITATILCLVLLATVLVTVAGCQKDKLSNENTPLVLASEALDGVFNPFFYTSGADGEIIGQTQVSLLSGDAQGNIVAGWNEPSVAFKYSVVRHGTRDDYESTGKYDNYYTDYYFAIKDNLKFSDGTALTMHDVLFNMYMFLDPAYTGSSTLYSVDIQGLKAYREQTENEYEQGSNTFALLASARINAIEAWADNNREGDWDDFAGYEADMTPHIKNDILKLHELFKKELEQDWLSTADTGSSDEFVRYVDRNGNRLINEDWQVFLMYYGLIVPNPKYDSNNNRYYELIYNYDTNMKTDKDTLLELVYGSMVGDAELATKTYKQHLISLLDPRQYQSGTELYNIILADIMREELGGSLAVPSISGITVLKNQQSIPVDANGNTAQLLDKNEQQGSYEVLRVRINGEDPKAIQNLSVTVAPGHYYSTKALWNEALADTDYVSHFGVSWSDSDFMNSVRVNQLPLGAGPYQAANSAHKVTKSKSEFFSSDNIVYMVRNEYFMLGAPIIHKLRFKVVSSTQMYNEVARGGVHYASPQAKKDTVDDLNTKDKNKLSFALGDNLGYGYIGINANFIHNIWIRRAIMTTLDPNLTVTYYGGSAYASVITRPMSKTLTNYYDNWETYVYSDPLTGEKYSYAFDDPATAKAEGRDVAALVYARDYGGCSVGTDGKLRDPDGNKLKYTFTVAGDVTDHPAYNMLTRSATILNSVGFEITVTNDSQALSKLANGQLTVWAAAWSSSSDPDMYQVYHKNSSATSTKAWGYGYLTGNEVDSYQRDIVDRLADLIDQGRETSIVDERKAIYTSALDTLMELAVEYPTYQRKMLYVWTKGIFDEKTLYTGNQVTAYRSPLSDIWKVSFLED